MILVIFCVVLQIGGKINRGGIMRSYKCILLLLGMLILSPCIVYASDESQNYDYRNDTINNSDDYEEVNGLGKVILQELYEINDINICNDTEQALDVSGATKVLVYKSEDFLALLKDNNMMESVKNHTNYCWKIPIDDTNEVVYTVVYFNSNNEWSYYTASSNLENGKNQVEYIFEKEKIADVFVQNEIKIQQVFAVTVSEIGLDCLMVDSGTEVLIIPYAARPDFLEITNGQIYSPKEMYEKIDNYITALSYEYTNEAGGGVGYSEKSNSYIYIAGVALLSMAVMVKLSHNYLKRKKRM